MKKVALLIIGSLALSNTVYAVKFDVEGDIGQVRYIDANSTYAVVWRRFIWFELKNTNITANCPKFNGEYRIAVTDGNEVAVSMILAAKMANKRVMVTVNDEATYDTGGYCLLQYFTIL